MENTATHTCIYWTISGTWNSFSSAGHMEFKWSELTEEGRAVTRYLKLSSLDQLFRNIGRGYRCNRIGSYKLLVRTGKDLDSKRLERYIDSIQRYADKYGIEVVFSNTVQLWG